MNEFPDIDYIALGRRIRSARKALQITQSQLAEMIGTSTSFMGHVERGSRHCSVENLLRLAIALKTSIDTLLSDSYTPPQSTPESTVLTPEQQNALQEVFRVFGESLYNFPYEEGESGTPEYDETASAPNGEYTSESAEAGDSSAAKPGTSREPK